MQWLPFPSDTESCMSGFSDGNGSASSPTNVSTVSAALAGSISSPPGTSTASSPPGKSLFRGIPTITDGAGAVVWVEINITQAACAYPITSSTTMGGGYSAAVANGQKNLWGDKLIFLEPESEHSAA